VGLHEFLTSHPTHGRQNLRILDAATLQINFNHLSPSGIIEWAIHDAAR
jgi:hypothetical protein